MHSLSGLSLEIAGAAPADEARVGEGAWARAAARRPDAAAADAAALSGEALLLQLLSSTGVRLDGLTPHQSVRIRPVVPAATVGASAYEGAPLVGEEVEMMPGTSVDLTKLRLHAPKVLRHPSTCFPHLAQSRPTSHPALPPHPSLR